MEKNLMMEKKFGDGEKIWRWRKNLMMEKKFGDGEKIW